MWSVKWEQKISLTKVFSTLFDEKRRKHSIRQKSKQKVVFISKHRYLAKRKSLQGHAGEKKLRK